MEAMSQQEYLVVFLSFIVGLGLTELLQSLRELIQPHRRVRWHPLPLTWVVIVFLAVAQHWWAFYDITLEPVWQNYFAFLILLSSAISLYLVCAFALPSAEAGDEIDLEQFYFLLPRRIWFFGATIVLVVAGQTIGWLGDLAVTWSGGEWFRLAMGLLFGGMIATERKSYHWGVTVFCLSGLLVFVTQFTLQLVR